MAIKRALLGFGAIALAGIAAEATGGLIVTDVSAKQLNLEEIIFGRLKANGATRRIHSEAGFAPQSVKLNGNIQTNGIKFKIPGVVPERPLVLQQQNLANCNDRESTLNVSVNKSTENSETFSKTNTIASTTTITAGYSSPLGGSVEASQSIEVSGSNTSETSHSETVTWDSGINVPVGPRKAVQIQFVVSESKLDVPWSTDVIVSGPAEITYVKPANATLCMYNDKDNRGRSKCISGASAVQWGNLKHVKWDGHNKNMNDQISGLRIDGNATVTFYKHSEYRGTAWTYTSTTGWVGGGPNDEFSSMRFTPLPTTVKKTFNIETYLKGAEQRVALKGTYKGVNGVQGDFRTSSPVTLTEKDCGLVARKAVGTSARAAKGKPVATGVISGKAAAGLKPFASKPIAVVKPRKRTAKKQAMNR